MTAASAKRRTPASSGLGLAHQAIDPASLDCSLFEPAGATATLVPPVEQDFALREEHEEPTVSDGGRLTLGQLVDSVWEGLHAAGAAGCPACGARMARVAGVGRCGGCGSSLN